MAKMTFKAGDEWALKLSRLAAQSDEISKKAIFSGAKLVADKIKSDIRALPEEKYRKLKQGEKFTGITKLQKKDLIESFGVTPIDRNRDGDWNAKIGFDGYGSIPTKKYPKGLPNQLLARSIESGSSVRQKNPFIRRAVNSTKKSAIAKMGDVIDNEIAKIMK